MEIFKQLNHDGVTVILVTHEQHVAQYSHRVLQMKDGAIISDSGGPSC